jgi:cardiolipin synthase
MENETANNTSQSSGNPWFTVGADQVRLLRDGGAMFPALLDAINSARSEVLMEMYWFGQDRVGVIVRDALLAAVKRGVRVRIIYDAFGSRTVPERFWQILDRERNASVRVYGPLAPWRKRFNLGRVFHRNHRKFIVVDGVHAFVGGINVGEEWWPQNGGTSWRDDAVELVGPTAQEVRSLFWRTWRRLGGFVPSGVPQIPAEGNGAVWLIANDRRFSTRREIRRTYLQEIRKARSSIDIANAYFLPDRQVLRALVAARRRGVPVRVLVPQKSDVPAVTLAQRSLLKHLIEKGIEVHAYGSSILHAKTAVIDDFATIGSYNLDYRSWRFNLECNIAVFDKLFADRVRKSFGDDLETSIKLGLDHLNNRPRLEKITSWILFHLHFLL